MDRRAPYRPQGPGVHPRWLAPHQSRGTPPLEHGSGGGRPALRDHPQRPSFLRHPLGGGRSTRGRAQGPLETRQHRRHPATPTGPVGPRRPRWQSQTRHRTANPGERHRIIVAISTITTVQNHVSTRFGALIKTPPKRGRRYSCHRMMTFLTSPDCLPFPWLFSHSLCQSSAIPNRRNVCAFSHEFP